MIFIRNSAFAVPCLPAPRVMSEAVRDASMLAAYSVFVAEDTRPLGTTSGQLWDV